MRQELEDQIVSAYPDFFPDIYGDPSKTCLAFGLTIGDGWFDLFNQLCKDIKALNPAKFSFVQVKEKFGGGRFYYNDGNEEISKLIHQAEKDSYLICESCGTKEGVTSEGSWIITLCKKCRLKTSVFPTHT